MESIRTKDYFIRKTDLLGQCIAVSESLFGSLRSEDLLPGILLQREDLINRIEILERDFKQEEKTACAPHQKEQLDRQVQLLLAMDRDMADAICKIQVDLLAEIKENKKRQQIANYSRP